MNTILTPDPSDPDELYVYEERLGILMAGEKREPTPLEISLAVQDVVEFRAGRTG